MSLCHHRTHLLLRDLREPFTESFDDLIQLPNLMGSSDVRHDVIMAGRRASPAQSLSETGAGLRKGNCFGGPGVLRGRFDVAGGQINDRGLDNRGGPSEHLTDLHRTGIGDQRRQPRVPGSDHGLQMFGQFLSMVALPKLPAGCAGRRNRCL